LGEQNDWALVVKMTVQESEGVTPKVGVVGRKVVPQRDTLWLSGADAINLVFGIIIHVVLTRALLSDEYGTFVLLLDFFHVCVILVDLGLPTLIARDGGRLGNHLSELLTKISSLQIVLMWVIAIAAMFVVGSFNSVWKNPAFLLAIGAGLQVLAYSFRSAFRALGEARLEALVRVSDRAIVALLMATWATDLPTLAGATALGPAFALAISMSVWKWRIEPGLNEPNENAPETAKMGRRDLVRTGLPFLVAGAALIINIRIEKLLLGVLATPQDVAVFQIAWLGFIAGYGPILSLRAVLLSWFGEVRDDYNKLLHRYNRALFATGILALIGMGIGLLVAPFAFGNLFPEYTELVERPFYGLLLAWLFHTMASPSLALIQVSEKPWNYSRILWLGIIVSTIASLYLIPTQPSAVDGAVVAAILGSLFVFAFAFTGAKSWLTTQSGIENLGEAHT
jgi:O-antigen/teichoic acid export membrane protein